MAISKELTRDLKIITALSSVFFLISTFKSKETPTTPVTSAKTQTQAKTQTKTIVEKPKRDLEAEKLAKQYPDMEYQMTNKRKAEILKIAESLESVDPEDMHDLAIKACARVSNLDAVSRCMNPLTSGVAKDVAATLAIAYSNEYVKRYGNPYK